MNELNRYGQMRLDYLTSRRPQLLERIECNGSLLSHLITFQRTVAWELGQMISAGVEEDAAERYVIREYIQNPDLA